MRGSQSETETQVGFVYIYVSWLPVGGHSDIMVVHDKYIQLRQFYTVPTGRISQEKALKIII